MSFTPPRASSLRLQMVGQIESIVDMVNATKAKHAHTSSHNGGDHNGDGHSSGGHNGGTEWDAPNEASLNTHNPIAVSMAPMV